MQQLSARSWLRGVQENWISDMYITLPMDIIFLINATYYKCSINFCMYYTYIIFFMVEHSSWQVIKMSLFANWL